jgi:hypothetical protein
VKENPGFRSPTLRLPVTVRCVQQQAAPWHDLWGITMDETSLLELSAELLGMGDLPPRLDQIRRLTEKVIAQGIEKHQSDWEHGFDPRTLRSQSDAPIAVTRKDETGALADFDAGTGRSGLDDWTRD